MILYGCFVIKYIFVFFKEINCLGVLFYGSIDYIWNFIVLIGNVMMRFNYNFVIYFYFLKDIILFESKNKKLILIFILFFLLFLYKFGVEKILFDLLKMIRC